MTMNDILLHQFQSGWFLVLIHLHRQARVFVSGDKVVILFWRVSYFSFCFQGTCDGYGFLLGFGDYLCDVRGPALRCLPSSFQLRARTSL